MLVPDHIPKIKVKSLPAGPSLHAGHQHTALTQAGQTLRWTFGARASPIHDAPQDFFQKDCWAHHPKPYQVSCTARAL